MLAAVFSDRDGKVVKPDRDRFFILVSLRLTDLDDPIAARQTGNGAIVVSDELIREIDEDLKRERYEKLWSQYGNYLIAMAVVIVLLTAGVVGWREYQSSQRIAQSGQFASAQALLEEGKFRDAGDAFGALANTASAGYQALAQLRQAAALARDGDRAGAIAVYDGLSANARADDTMRDLAGLMAALQHLELKNGDDALQRLKTLTAPDRPFRFSALELRGLVHLSQGNTAEAKKDFTTLSDDSAAPAGVRARAAELLAALGGAD